MGKGKGKGATVAPNDDATPNDDAPNVAMDAVRAIFDACVAADRPSSFARAYGDTVKSGSWTRGILRGKVGVHVNSGDAFDLDAKRALLTNARIQARIVARAVDAGASESDARDALATLLA